MRPRSKRCNCQRRGDGWRLPVGCWTHEGLSFQNHNGECNPFPPNLREVDSKFYNCYCLLFCLPLGDGGGSKRGCCGCCFFKTGTSNQYFLSNLKSNKVNRCLARYSPRATTDNRPTTGHWISLHGLAQIDQKCQYRAKFGRFWAKNPFFYWRNHKFCYPHNEKPT